MTTSDQLIDQARDLAAQLFHHPTDTSEQRLVAENELLRQRLRELWSLMNRHGSNI